MDGSLPWALGAACVLLGIGAYMRTRLAWLRALHLPASVVAGVLGFVMIQTGLRLGGDVYGFSRAVAAEWARWPAWLIAVVFAGLLLGHSAGGSFTQAIRRGARSACLAWIIILGQIAIGLTVYLFMEKSRVPPTFGQLLEVSWAGGHGASAAMGQIYAAQDFPAGRDLAFFLATVGLVWGVISGMVLVNIAVRRGWARAPHPKTGAPAPATGAQTNPAAPPRLRPEVLDPLALQVVILAAAMLVGVLLQWGFSKLAGMLVSGGDPKTRLLYTNVPLFLFALLGGAIVRQILRGAGAANLIDSYTISRLQGVAMELLIVAALATVRIESLSAYFIPIAALVVGAGAWSLLCLLVVAPRLLPRAYWFELGLLNYGFSTANTPQGIMLLRIVDPDLSSGAAEDYAVAAPLSAPFIGGGVITFLGLPVLLASVPAIAVIVALVAAIVTLWWLGVRSRQ